MQSLITLLTWKPACVGCYWYSGNFCISTVSLGSNHWYELTCNRVEIGKYTTLAGAKSAATLEQA